MKIKWKIVRRGQGERTPTRQKVCQDCGEELTKFRFEIMEHETTTTGFELEQLRSHVCPQCVLMADLNRTTFWDHLNRFFKLKYNRNEVVEKGGATSKTAEIDT